MKKRKLIIIEFNGSSGDDVRHGILVHKGMNCLRVFLRR
jgi:hypothetical protein